MAPLSKNTQNAGGNALFIVMVLLVLFAGLYMAMSKSMRIDGGSSVNREKAALVATEMVSYGERVATTITILMMNKNCRDFHINFSNPFIAAADYNNTMSPGNKSCHVFDAAGGGMKWLRPAPGAATLTTQEFIFSGHSRGQDVGTAYADLMMFLPNTDPTVCQAINETQGVETIPSIAWLDVSTFKLGYSSAPSEATGFSTKRYGCVYNSWDQLHYFFYVLLPR